MTEPMIHPVWCTGVGCVDRGQHESEQVRCNADQTAEWIEYRIVAEDDRQPLTAAAELVIVRVVLVQPLERPVPHLEVVFYDVPESEDVVILTPAQARQVVAGLTQHLQTLESAGGEVA